MSSVRTKALLCGPNTRSKAESEKKKLRFFTLLSSPFSQKLQKELFPQNNRSTRTPSIVFCYIIFAQYFYTAKLFIYCYAIKNLPPDFNNSDWTRIVLNEGLQQRLALLRVYIGDLNIVHLKTKLLKIKFQMVGLYAMSYLLD